MKKILMLILSFVFTTTGFYFLQKYEKASFNKNLNQQFFAENKKRPYRFSEKDRQKNKSIKGRELASLEKKNSTH